MNTGCILSDYIEHAMAAADYDKLADGTYAGAIPPCKGVVAFASTLAECEHALRSTLEDWLFLGLRLGPPDPRALRRTMIRQVEGIPGREIGADEWAGV